MLFYSVLLIISYHRPSGIIGEMLSNKMCWAYTGVDELSTSLAIEIDFRY